MKNKDYQAPDIREIILSTQASMLVTASGIEAITESEYVYDEDCFVF